MRFEFAKGLDSVIPKRTESTISETGITTVKIEYIHPINSNQENYLTEQS